MNIYYVNLDFHVALQEITKRQASRILNIAEMCFIVKGLYEGKYFSHIILFL